MAITETAWAAAEISNEVYVASAKEIANRLAGIVANDDRVRIAIESALAAGADERGVLAAVAAVLTHG